MNENAIDRNIVCAFIDGLISDDGEREKGLEYIRNMPAVNPQPCGDAIDRAEAIKIASGYCHPANVAKELAKLPPVNPQPCEDAISRQAVLDIVDSYSESRSNVEDVTQDMISDILALPPVNPTKTGHWIKMLLTDMSDIAGQCSECGFIHKFVGGHTAQYNYCPNCGCRMVEPQEI